MRPSRILDMDDYQRLCERTASETVFTNDAYTAIGLCEEAGEYAGVVKKQAFHGHPADDEKRLEELGDCFWYLAMAALKDGFLLSEVASANIAKLQSRYPRGFTSTDSIRRVDEEA